MIDFMKLSTSVFPNSLLSKEDFAKEAWKRCMVFVFMGRWVYGKDGQKQWRNFDLRDLKFNMRLFELWKRKEAAVMAKTPEYQKLPAKSDPKKRKRKRGRVAYKKKGRVGRVASSSSASESPMKRVTFDLTTFSSDDEIPFEVRGLIPPEIDDEGEGMSDNGEDANDDDTEDEV